jgi:caffeoyl-CoA O-methyltransferase
VRRLDGAPEKVRRLDGAPEKVRRLDGAPEKELSRMTAGLIARHSPRVMHLVSAPLEQYAHDHTKPRGDVFDELRDYTQAHVEWPQMQVGRVEGALLQMLAAISGARRILEIGTYTGYSALCMAQALPSDGKVVTCDKSEEFTAVARRFWAASPHGAKIDLRLGDALDTLRALPQDEPFDMAFIDADKVRYVDYYEEIVPLLRPGGLVCLDNVLWSGEVLDPQSDDARGIVAVNDRVQADPRVDNVLLPVRDGVMIARKL